MIVTVGKNGAIPLPDNVELSEDGKLNIGDILLCTLMEDKRSIKLEKFSDQTLNDEQIVAHGFLTRVEAPTRKIANKLFNLNNCLLFNVRYSIINLLICILLILLVLFET